MTGNAAHAIGSQARPALSISPDLNACWKQHAQFRLGSDDMRKQTDAAASPRRLSQARPASAVDPNSIEAREPRELLVAKIQEANASWRTGFIQMQHQEVDFALRLARCSKPADAMRVCSEWMANRIDSVISMQTQFLDLWLNATSGADRLRSVDDVTQSGPGAKPGD